MPRIVSHSIAGLAAVGITVISISSIVIVPATRTLAIAPMLA